MSTTGVQALYRNTGIVQVYRGPRIVQGTGTQEYHSLTEVQECYRSLYRDTRVQWKYWGRRVQE
jgi:hypothetical protein